MRLRSFLTSLKSRPTDGTIRRSHRPRPPRLQVEVLDDRCLPSTFTVTNLLDSGTGSLRAAVAAADANPGGDDIDFGVTGSISLTSGQLDITDSLTINGPGAGALTVSGNHYSRVFGIAGDPTVVIAGLTVANGSATDARGGGIFMAGGTVTLDHVTVTGNYAVGAPGFFDYWSSVYSVGDGLGGGLYVAGGTLTLAQSTVSGNYAGGGAGFSDFDLGYSGGFAAGGGLYVAGGTVRVHQSTVSGNGASGGAGGDGLIYSGEPTYGGSGGAADGGGISVAAGSLEIHQSSIFDNAAFGGAGGQGYYYGSTTLTAGSPGVGAGGGLGIASAAPPLADLDSFTESHTINNRADFNPNISGPYSLNGTWVPPLAVSDVSTREGNTGTTAFVFTVRLSAPSNQAVSVNYATADGSATAGSDYQAASGTLTIPAGQTTGTIPVQVIGDRLAEANETFFVNLSAPTNATIADGQGAGTIVDDEPRISIGDRTVTEGNTGSTSATFTVTLSAAYDVNVSVNYATANGTATAGSDYQAASGTLTFAPGETSKTVTVQVFGDRLGEWNETFFVNLSSPTNGVVTDGQGAGTVLDDEPRISIGTVSKAEGRKNHTTLFTFTVKLSAAYDQAVTMSFRTADGTATTSDNDYVAKTGTLTFAPGETTKTITIEVKGDSKKEADETFYLDLFGNSSNSLFTNTRGIGTILNDD
jgi:Calx-beta domain